VLTLPLTAGLLALSGDLPPAGIAYFVVLSVLALGLAFGRQAHLLAERQLAVVSERRLRREATLRSEELEAMTGLATTMTQTLEEAPIVEQALGVLHAAARATSAALHVEAGDGSRRLAAAAGAWHTDGSGRRPARSTARRSPRAGAARCCACRWPPAGAGSGPSRSCAPPPSRSRRAASSCSACSSTRWPSRCRTRATTARSSSRRSATR
jgi:hypothetical protein